jgi:hypothetical protein
MPRSVQQRVASKRREAECLRLRLEGESFEDIATQVGFKSPSGAYKAFRRALDGIGRDWVEEVYRLQLARLNTLLAQVWPGVENGDLRAIDTALKIMDRIDRLHGLDHQAKGDGLGEPDDGVLVIRVRS